MTGVTVGLNKTVALPTSLTNNQAIVTSSTLDLTKPGSEDNTSVNFLNNLGDYLLHLSFRRYADKIVLNSRTAAGEWGPEVVFPNLERAFGPNLTQATICVKDIGNAYQIYISNNYLSTYTKRIGGNAEKLYYTINTGQDSVFSNPITVEMQQ